MNGVESRRVGGGPASEGGPAPRREPRVQEIRAKNYYYSVLDDSDIKVLRKLDEVIDEARKPQALANVLLSVAQYLCGMDDVIHDITIRAENDKGRYRLKITW